MTYIESIEDFDPKNATPMIRHWWSIKKKYSEHLIAYRMGDFYEFFYDDAIRVSKLLGITQTKRKVGDDEYPLAGIPHHSGQYLNNLVKKGETVVLVEQLEDPSTVKGRIVKRGVVRILSPGTITEADMLDSTENNYIASLVKESRGVGCAFADISTGEFVAAEYVDDEKDPMEKVLSLFARFNPVELIIPAELKADEKLFIFLTDITEAIIKTYDNYTFHYDQAADLIQRHFNISNLKGFGLESSEIAVKAAGGLLAFLKETQRDVIPNIFKIKLIKEQNILHLDYTTQRNLELITSLWEKGKDTTLFSVFNHTETPMGARLLRKIILQPLSDVNAINQRLNIVQKFKDDIFLRSDLREELSVIGDLERYINRITYVNRTNARDLINIKNSLEKIPKIRELLEKANIPEIREYLKHIKDFKDVRTLIQSAIKEDPPPTVKEGNIIEDEYDKNLDELRDVLRNGKDYLLEYEKEQKNQLKLNSGLKIGHNNILGYYVQITKNTLKSIEKIPDEYVERQTLKNSKRFTTEKLKELEHKIVSAEEKIHELEYELFCEVREKVEGSTLDILETAKNIAFIDVYACFAEISEKYDYCRPIIEEESNRIVIKEGRHPVVEQMDLTERFIPNDCYIDSEKEQILIITGPNMSGKSTFLRQVALICLIGQMGCFVPAVSARIGVIDQVFTRIGASDDLARKLSTFMIEMTETAKILNYATSKSLVIIDELGRGTSTSDGQSIAIATLEKLHEINAKTLFSTHYHQLTEINLPRVKNYHLDIIENDDGSINFVRKLKPGSTDKSYGIHVARLAGLPDDVIIKAFQILEQIEKDDPFKATIEQNNKNGVSTAKFHEKLIYNKEKQLKTFNKKLKEKNTQIKRCDEQLERKTKEFEEKIRKIESLEDTIKQLKAKRNIFSTQLEKKPNKEKKTVQTTFFKPIVKKEPTNNEKIEEIMKIIQNTDINSLTPVEAMKKFLEMKEKLEFS
ncbi:MAG: DNA mismatch repair protein MutS [Candidatus Lokiarchaeota archaeon]|nr:DNA mismatch repair protein MutS [Candidatus Lokiarchaeota archaeon]